MPNVSNMRIEALAKNQRTNMLCAPTNPKRTSMRSPNLQLEYYDFADEWLTIKSDEKFNKVY